MDRVQGRKAARRPGADSGSDRFGDELHRAPGGSGATNLQHRERGWPRKRYRGDRLRLRHDCGYLACRRRDRMGEVQIDGRGRAYRLQTVVVKTWRAANSDGLPTAYPPARITSRVRAQAVEAVF